MRPPGQSWVGELVTVSTVGGGLVIQGKVREWDAIGVWLTGDGLAKGLTMTGSGGLGETKPMDGSIFLPWAQVERVLR